MISRLPLNLLKTYSSQTKPQGEERKEKRRWCHCNTNFSSSHRKNQSHLVANENFQNLIEFFFIKWEFLTPIVFSEPSNMHQRRRFVKNLWRVAIVTFFNVLFFSFQRINASTNWDWFSHKRASLTFLLHKFYPLGCGIMIMKKWKEFLISLCFH